ncbi:cell surface glycoprotein 1 [Salvelinus namaycush]|uniref:Cell surface glycoprotein 1 n=1 Tax=Salvelinus namaycush TaxID=8040 RepID=A0A8U0PIG4_SALNM|nr:cell surface glycoprotein 1 [Salvelinus namaycush]
MEDEVKEDPTRPNEDPTRSKETMSTWKAGWVKKASGRFLASYKDRYIQVQRTELVVYENEDLATYLEKVDLENYDKCHELRSAFTKKNRLVLIRAAKSGNKVHDVKFQAQNLEEKEAWIKAFSDGINRAKNKIFDEVKVDETSQLEHATRTRAKGNRNRRPPTRIHMKEVANVSSDGILRHDLDAVDASIPNGTHHITTDTTETPKKAVKPPMPPTSKPSEAPEECQTTQSPDEGLPSETEPSPQKVLEPPMPPSKEVETAAASAGDQLSDETSTDRSPEKKVLKPPMPPSKEAKPTVSAEDQPPEETAPEKKVLKPPMPPSKDTKPAAPAGDQPPRNTSPEGSPEQCFESGVESAPPPTPPGKPIGGSTDNLAEASQSSQEHRSPTPPSKDKKPTQTAVQEGTEEASGRRKKSKEDEAEEKEEEGSETIASDVQQSSIPEGAEDEEESPSSQLTTPMTPLEVKVEPSVTDHPEVTTTTIEEETQKVAEPMAQEQKSAPSGGVDISPNEEPQTMKSSQLTVTPSVQTPEPIKKSPGPPGPPIKKKPVVLPPPKAVVVAQDVHLSEPKNQATDKTKNNIITTTPGEKLNSITSPTPAVVTTTSPTEETEDLKVPVVVATKSEFPVVVLSLSDPEPDSSCSSPVSCHLSPEKKSEREEEKSVDSGQHSDIDVDEEWSESRDTLAASTAALMGSQAGLDALMDESQDGDTETPNSLGLSTVEDCPSTTQTPQDNPSGLHPTFLQVRVSQASHCPPIPFKPLAKLMSTSLGDLLSEASLGENVKQPITDVAVTKATVGPQDLTDLENEVALELENTGELLGSFVPKGSTEVGQNSALAGGDGLEDRSPEEMLARAMEKLRKADQFLRQAKRMKDSKHSENTAKRNSW